MSHDKLATAIHRAADRAAARARSVYRGTVVDIYPVVAIELHHVAHIVDENEGLQLASWVKFYHATTGLAVDDTVLASKVDGEWTIIDVEGDGDPVIPGGSDAPATTSALGIVKVSTAPVDPANPIAVSDTDPRNSNARTPTAHTHPESDVVGLAADLAARELTANKGVANGYASLDATGKVPSAQLPAAGGTPDASTTVKGVTELSVAPAVATVPIAVGDNDPRNTNARTPTAHTHPESDVINLVTDLAARELTANKGAANGYAPLVSSKVPITNLPDATTGAKGIVQLAGDLAGTAASPTVPGLANKQDTSAKGAASGYASLDSGTKVPVAQLPDATTLAKGIVQLAGDLAGTAAAPVVAVLAITDAKVATANKDGTAATPSMRTLGTGAAQAAAGNDARLSDARAPTAGSVVDASVATGAAIAESKLNLATDAAAGTGSRRTLGTGALQAAAGNDARLSDARTPTAGSVVDASVSGAAAIAESKLNLATDAAAGTGSRRTLGTGALQAAAGNDARLSDRRQPLTTLETTLATDFTLTSPASTKVLQGSFVADFTEVEITVHVNGYDIDSRVAYTGFVFFYGTVAQPVWNDNQAADRPGVTRVVVGSVAGQPGAFTRRVVLTGLTVGSTYNWALAAGIVGFSTTVALPEACSFVTVSKSGAPAGALLDDFNDRLIVVSSATKMYLIRSNHTTKIKDELVGNGIPFVTGHGTGLAAISPDGNRILVTNTSLGSASLYDVYDPPQPVLLSTFALTMTNPFAAVWAPDGSACYVADFAQTPGHVKKITGLTGANYAPVVSATVATLGTVGSSPAHLRITPDGTKVLVGDGTTEFYVVNTSTMAVTKVTVPGATSAAGIDAISNTQAIVSYGTNTFAILDLNALTFSATFTDPGLNGQLYAFKDGMSSLAMRQLAGSDAIGHINHPVNSGNTNLNMYTHWSTSGTPKDHVIDDQGNIMVVNNTPNNLAIWYGSQFLLRPTGTGTALAERAIVQVRGGH